MSLFGTIQQSAGALQAAQIGLQVVGNNIANTNTPGYIRQQLEQASSTATRDGSLIKGHGVRPVGIVQVVDKMLVERMINAGTALAGAVTSQKAYAQLEELTNDLNDGGLSKQLTLFDNALHELSTQPADSSLRDFVILQGETLAANLKNTRTDALERRETWNGELDQMTSDINRLVENVARLNLEIATIEGGGLIHSDATGLRDQRYRDLEELATYTKINVQEQPSGAVAVFVGGDYLVTDGNFRQVYTAYNADVGGSEIRIIETDSPLQVSEGKIAATQRARDEIFTSFVDSVDEVASALIRAVNDVHSQGQGRRGHLSVLSTVESNAGVPLKNADLAWEPKNGSFDMSIVDADGQPVSHHRISVQMLGQVSDSTVASIVADVNAIGGISARVTSEGRIEILSDSPTSVFTFGEDTSGFLAAAGINTFFSGSDAFDIDVNQTLKDDPDLLAISAGGIAEDTDILTRMVDLVDAPLEHLDGRSIRDNYQDSISSLGQKISLQNSAADGLRNFYDTLKGQHLAISGVNIDEESILMITYQRAFQASSRVIQTAAEMLELLVTL
jgi:flagellar hook-associated protein 1 FlgK